MFGFQTNDESKIRTQSFGFKTQGCLKSELTKICISDKFGFQQFRFQTLNVHNYLGRKILLFQKNYQKEDLQDAQETRFARHLTALMIYLQLLPGQNLKKVYFYFC